VGNVQDDDPFIPPAALVFLGVVFLAIMCLWGAASLFHYN
jgi:hypothetical protein